MKRLARHLFTLLCAICLLLCAGVCVFWYRGQTMSDQVEWAYDRYLPDRSAAATDVYLTSDQRLWVNLCWGHVGPYNGHLVWGYHVNADNSGGRPRVIVSHTPYDQFLTFGRRTRIDFDAGAKGVGPLRWLWYTRNNATEGEQFRSLRLGASHWAVALVLMLPTAMWLRSFLRRRRARRRGLCPGCGYDLRASPERCPECGAEIHPLGTERVSGD